MKTVLILAFVAAVANAAVAPVLKKLIDSVDKCAKKEGITKEEIFQLFDERKLPTTKEQKCAVDCYMQDFGFVKDGKVDWDYSLSMHEEKHRGDPENKKKAAKVTEACRNIVNLDGKKECEKGEVVLKCLFEKGKEFNIPARNHTKDLADYDKE